MREIVHILDEGVGQRADSGFRVRILHICYALFNSVAELCFDHYSITFWLLFPGRITSQPLGSSIWSVVLNPGREGEGADMGANYIVCTVLGRLGWRLCPGPTHYIAVKCLEGVANVAYGTCRLSRSPSVAHLKGLQEFYTISSSPPSQNRSKKVFTLSVMFSFQSAGPEPLLGRHKHCKWSISPQ